MNIEIEIPRITDFKIINELARQIHELHVKWNPKSWGNLGKY